MCVMCSYIHCVLYAVELEGVSELQQAMSQQRKELLGKMELLKSKLTSELYVWVYERKLGQIMIFNQPCVECFESLCINCLIQYIVYGHNTGEYEGTHYLV